jgi:uncharacterized damage-inducible protein DinB
MVVMNESDRLRDQLLDLLDFTHAHVNFEAAIDDLPAEALGKVPAGAAHSIWQIVEHMRIAQNDIWDFSVNAGYKDKKWPEDYWPKSPEPPSAQAWDDSIAAYKRDREAMSQLVRDQPDLFAKIPHGTGQTYLREVVLISHHASYHLGEIVTLRRLLGVWK